MIEELRILFLEDVPVDAELMERELRREGVAFRSRRVDTEAAFCHELEAFGPDIVLSDLSLPGFNGMAALAIARERLADIPFIFVSGTMGEEKAIESLKCGATDYVLKTNLGRLAPAIRRAIHESEERAARRQAEERLRESEIRFSLFMQHLPGVAFMKDLQGRLTFVNQKWEKIANVKAEEALGRSFNELWPARTAPPCAADGKNGVAETIERIRQGDGMHSFYVQRFPILGLDGQLAMMGGIAVDITDRLRAEKERTRLSAIIDAASDVICMADPQGRLLYVNRAGRAILGMNEAGNVTCSEGTYCDSGRCNQIFHHEAIACALREGVWMGETELLAWDGQKMPMSQSVIVHRGSDGKVEYLSTIMRDITEVKRYEAQLEYQANYDELTGLPNRALLADCINQAMAGARRNGGAVAVIFLDLDYFKFINDSLGHNMGDLLLKAVASRLSPCVRKGDTVARHGGDEFVLILVNGVTEEAAGLVAQKIIDAMSKPFKIDGRELFITCSAGISLFPKDGDSSQVLLKNADTALYRAKDVGRNSFQFYTEEMNARNVERLTLENSLRRAMDDGELLLHYQPRVDLATGRVIGMEALARWNHQEWGAVSPQRFIPLAEETGLIVPLGKRLLRSACAQDKAWKDAGLPPVCVSVNLSARQFMHKDIVSMVAIALDETGLSPELLELRSPRAC